MSFQPPEKSPVSDRSNPNARPHPPLATQPPISARIRLGLAAGSGLLLTGAFPNIDVGWLAWIAIVPLLTAVRNVHWKRGFGLGFLAGMVHYLSLIYWVAYTMRTYGHLPWPVCISILVLLAAYLALFFGALTAYIGGVTYNYFILNALVTTEAFLIFKNLWILPIPIIMHVIGYFACLREPRIFDLWLTKVSKCPRVRNYSRWGCNSYAA